MAAGEASVNRCPPGGAAGVQRLAQIAGLPCPDQLDAGCGIESPRTVAWIDEDWCIGCTLCIEACPTDAIVGSHKRMHTVIEAFCTGCELCVPVCPVDCIQLENASGDATGWAAWSTEQAGQARARYQARQQRLARESVEPAADQQAHAREKPADGATELDRKRAIVEAALARAAKLRSRPP